MSERESGGVSLLSNGTGAAESSDEGVHDFISRLWDNSNEEEGMVIACEEQIEAIAGSLLS
ncbi:hypothetical protein FRX31_021820 [Thalictrum thalictroides]|uniref:Uncharacterized protein n=1 Tax=Thalictrum thalictroides TaxID=46969 RepID=A0A7J6VUQ3_THATH|nr:hypothetical protein FRX31_021820 [Thalictrum thalictroides]